MNSHNEIKPKFACILEASESARLRMEESLPNYQAEQHLERDGLRCTKQVSSTCRTKFDRGVIAVGCGAVSDKNCWMV